MYRGAEISLFAALAAGLMLSGCARKHRVAPSATLPAPLAPSAAPQIPGPENGIASWYGHPYHGRAAANGEIYDMEKLTAAHRTLPFGTWVRVTNLGNNKSVDVRITDRGPFVDGRVIDLSHRAAELIDMVGPGIAQVHLDILSAPALPASANWFAVQAGAFADKDRAERLRGSLEREYGTARLVYRAGTPSLWRVLVGTVPTEQAANSLARRVKTEVGPAFVVRLDQAASSDAPQTAATGASHP
jgi:rare lipoprotein A